MSPRPSPSPSPNDEPTPSPDAAADSGADSSKADGAGLLGDAGPDFQQAPPTPATPPIDAGAALAGGELWNVSRVKAILTAKGVLLHGALAVDKQSTEWVYTQADLQAIAPPLTRILNRYEPTRVAAGAGDEMALGIGLLGYAARSISERRRALAQLDSDEPEPVPDPISADDVDERRQVDGFDDDGAGVPRVAPDFPAPDEAPPITSPRRR
jgi:hypothetical protein